ncbi:MAG: NAD(P)H-dependent oxidoreductase subunit E [Actinomycetota bacterium]
MADLHIGADQATSEERAVVDAVVDGSLGPAVVVEGERLVYGGTTRRNERRHLLLPALHSLQNQRGWISPGGMNYASEQLQVPPAEAYGVATFYEMFRVDDPGHDQDVVHVCVDAACQIAGAAGTIDRLRAAGAKTHASPCLGQCERPVAQFIQGRAKPDRVEADAEPYVLPQAGQPGLRLLRRIGATTPVDPTDLGSYLAAGGYRALARAFERGPEGVVEEVVVSGLMGRGGAAFPTGIKWRAVAAEEANDKYVVVNADESEPGTFKDRTLLENDPFALIEAVTIAGFATGATKGWIYIRGEYPLATERLERAIAAARQAGYLGRHLAPGPDGVPSAFSFDIEIRRGAGAYICGEETALFNSLEGFRGEPRQKPPFPTTNGLFDRPTAINNPETLFNVLDIVLNGGAAYAAIGTERSTGSKLFCLSGNVAHPGVYEVDFGATLREVLDLAGGVVGDLRAVLLGGAAGSFVGPDLLDMPLTFEDVRDAGVSLGSGVVMVFNSSVDMPAVVTRIAEFFRNESCGQCVPCRVGTTRQHEVLLGLSPGPSHSAPVVLNGQASLLDEIDRAMKDASICGLGHTAATAVRSAMDLGLFPGPGGPGPMNGVDGGFS